MQKVPAADKLFVLVQLLLLVGLFFLLWWARAERATLYLRIAGMCCMVAGYLIALVAVFQVRNKITMYPTPVADASLISVGVFALVRHPMYAGIIWFCFGTGLFTGRLSLLIYAMILYLFFHIKSAYEEKRLTEKFPEYAAYRKKVMKFIPLGILKRK